MSHLGHRKPARTYIEKPTHPKRVTVWFGFWSRGIIGSFFFENEQREAITINGDCYRAMLKQFFFSTKIQEEDFGNIWFQQDGATWHTAEATQSRLSLRCLKNFYFLWVHFCNKLKKKIFFILILMPAASKSQSHTEIESKNKNKKQKKNHNHNQNTYLIQPINNSRLVNRKITVCRIFKDCCCCCCVVAFKKN